jgi:hypothetical protein
VRAGLTRLLSDVPVKSGYVEAQAGWSALQGAYGRLESGYRPLENVGLFGFGQIDRFGPMVGAGVRWTF